MIMKRLLVIIAFFLFVSCDGDGNNSPINSNQGSCHVGDRRCDFYSSPAYVELCDGEGWNSIETCDQPGKSPYCNEYYDQEKDFYNAACSDTVPIGTIILCREGDVQCGRFEIETEMLTCQNNNWVLTGSCVGIYQICVDEFSTGKYEARCAEKECKNGTTACFENDIKLCKNQRWVTQESCDDNGLECYYTNENVAKCGQVITDDFKPNIYLYPTAPLDITVKIGFPQGGRVTVSEPLYNDGWSVRVTPDGMIDGQWRFLFYESVQPNGWQRKRGYLVATDEMEQFFRNDLAARGFVGQEIEDFIDWWMPLLAEPGYLIVYPQDDTVIRTLEDLQLSVTPDSLLRHRYVIETTAEPVTIEPPADR